MFNCLKVLRLLETKYMSAGELAEKLGLRLSTLKYNFDFLLDADVIWVSEVKWSQRGRKIKINEPTEKIMILVSGCRNGCKVEILSMLINIINKELSSTGPIVFRNTLKTDIIFSDCRSD